jgi:dual specificity protein kinase YAK1
MLGLPPQWMLEQGKQTAEFFNMYSDEYGRRQYKLKSLEQYSKEHNVQEQPSKRYFQATTLPDIVKTYPMSRKSGRPADVQKEMTNRTSFIDFVTGLLHMDPNQRWTPEQAKLHPFITTEKFTQPFRPPVAASTAIQRSSARPSLNSSNSGSSSERHPFGGLPESSTNRQGSRTYQDAAAYNQHLIQQQAYNQAHVARQNQINNPYARADSAAANAQAQVAATQAQLAHAQAHAAQLHAATMSPSKHQIAGQQQQQQFESGRQSASTHSGNRSRSDTLTRMDVIPPQLARMGLDPPAHSMTPVLKREENLREWERQQQGGLVTGGSADRVSESKGKARDHQHLDLLNQQAEQNQHGHGQWPSHGSSTSSQQNFRQATAGNAMPFSVVVDGSQRQQVARGDHLGSAPIMAPPPAAYAAKQSANAAAGLSFDPYQPDSGQGGMSLQPSQYHTIGHTASTSPSLNSHMRLAGGQGAVANRHSIAVPHMSQSTLQGNSLASLQNLYNGPNDGSSGYVQQPPQPAAVATMLPVNANAANSSNIRNDGFGGLSDLMFGSNPGGGVVPVGGGAASTQRYSMLPNGALTSSHAIQPPHSPLENTAAFAPYHANSTSSHR